MERRRRPGTLRLLQSDESFVFSCGVIGLAAFAFTFMWLAHWLEAAYARDGLRTEGTVTRMWHHVSSSQNDHHVYYRFETASGERIENWEDVRPEIYHGFRVGGAVPIDYLPAMPHYNRVARETGETGYVIGMVVACIALLGSVWVASRAVRRAARLAWLLRRGARVDGVILDVVGRGPSSAKDAEHRLAYAFETPEGGMHEGRSASHPAPRLVELSRGDRVRVVYDAGRPEVNAWLEDGWRTPVAGRWRVQTRVET